MSDVFKPREFLESLKWYMYYECDPTCGKKQYFSHPDHPGFTVKLSPTSGTAVILQKNSIIAGTFHSYLLPEKLKTEKLL